VAIYAFDGTGNKDKKLDSKDTNVRKFFEAYVESYEPQVKTIVTGKKKKKREKLAKSKCVYIKGVGTSKLPIRKATGLLFGFGGKGRVRRAMKALRENVKLGDTTIDVVGFSRGAAEALEFVNRVRDATIGGEKGRAVRFLGIWDTVASFGIPGNAVNVGYDLELPDNVRNCCHAIALDERRWTFPLTRLADNAHVSRTTRNIREVWFRGYHSDVGGGNKNEGLSSIALTWMFQRARDAKLKIPEAHIDKHGALRAPEANPRTPKMDKKGNKRRPIKDTDVVHDSVTKRTKSGRLKANNPTRKTLVTGDDGKIRGKPFGA
jgi:uncharacterized protein (DUF2235 family)